MPAAAESAVRDYLVALKDPAALRDDDSIADIQRRIDETDDHVERLLLRQQRLDAESPSLERYEEQFVAHAKEWAAEQGVSASALADEGVPLQVLRRAGFSVRGRGRAPAQRGRRSTRRRVSAEDIRESIPKGKFTIKDVQEASGASAAVVRRVVQEQVDAGEVSVVGPDRSRGGPGRSPIVYERKAKKTRRARKAKSAS